MNDASAQKFVVVTNVCDGEVYTWILPGATALAEIQKFVVSLILQHEIHDMSGDFERDFLVAATEGRWADAWKVYRNYDRECESRSQYRWHECDLYDLSYCRANDPCPAATHLLSMLNEEDSDATSSA